MRNPEYMNPATLIATNAGQSKDRMACTKQDSRAGELGRIAAPQLSFSDSVIATSCSRTLAASTASLALWNPLASSPTLPEMTGDAPVHPSGLNNLADETVAAFHLGLPGWVFAAAGLVIASGLTWLLLSKTRSSWSIPSVVIMGAGAVAAFFAYVHLVFPWFAG